MHREAAEAWDLLRETCEPGALGIPKEACDQASLAAQRAEIGDCRGARAALDAMEASLQGLPVTVLAKPRNYEGRMASILAAGCKSP